MSLWTRKKKSSSKTTPKGDRGRAQKAKKTVKRSPPVPGQDGVWANDGREVGEDSAAEELALRSQPTPLVIGESKAFTTEMLPEDSIILLQVPNDGLLVSADPSGRGNDQ